MPSRKLISIEDYRRRVLRGFSDATLNGKLQAEIRKRESHCAETVQNIVTAFGDAERIDFEMIVEAAEFGHVAAVEALAAIIPVQEAQEYFDRALICVAVNDWAAPENYAAITKSLLKHGADPEAYDAKCRPLANATQHKEEVYALICAAIDAREDARDAKARQEVHRRQQHG